jgi:osmoprotectant transport system permease protein
MGCEARFSDRVLADRISLRFRAPPREMDLSLTYRALADRQVDLIAGNSTDGLIDALDLVEGTYKIDVAAHKHDGAPYDYHRLLHTLRVQSRQRQRLISSGRV